MDNNNISILGEAKKDSRLITPEQTLEIALREIKSGSKSPTRLVVIAVDDNASENNITWWLSQCSVPEAVSILEMIKAVFIDLIRGRK